LIDSQNFHQFSKILTTTIMTTINDQTEVECYACGDVPCVKQEDPMDTRLCESCYNESEEIQKKLDQSEMERERKACKIEKIVGEYRISKEYLTKMMTPLQITKEVEYLLKKYEPTVENGVISGLKWEGRALPCATPCETRCMNGRSWWKMVGYNFACACAWDALETDLTRKLIQKERDRIAEEEYQKKPKVRCDGCDEQFGERDLTDTQKGEFCDDCYDDRYNQCDCCGDGVDTNYDDDMGSDYDPYEYNEDCEIVVVCDDCREEFLEDVAVCKKGRMDAILEGRKKLKEFCDKEYIEVKILGFGTDLTDEEMYEKIYKPTPK